MRGYEHPGVRRHRADLGHEIQDALEEAADRHDLIRVPGPCREDGADDAGQMVPARGVDDESRIDAGHMRARDREVRAVQHAVHRQSLSRVALGVACLPRLDRTRDLADDALPLLPEELAQAGVGLLEQARFPLVHEHAAVRRRAFDPPRQRIARWLRPGRIAPGTRSVWSGSGGPFNSTVFPSGSVRYIDGPWPSAP